MKHHIFLIAPCIVDDLVPVGMVEGEEGLWCGQFKPAYIMIATLQSHSAGPVLKVDNIGGFKVGQGVLGLVLALTHFIVQLRTLRRKPNIRYLLFCKIS